MINNNFILQASKLKSIYLNSILGVAFSLLIAGGFYSQTLAVHSNKGIQGGKTYHTSIAQNKKGTFLSSICVVALQHLGISGNATEPYNSGHSSSSESATIPFIYLEEQSTNEINSIDFLNFSIFIEPEIRYYYSQPPVAFADLAVENFILSNLQTVILLN